MKPEELSDAIINFRANAVGNTTLALQPPLSGRLHHEARAGQLSSDE